MASLRKVFIAMLLLPVLPLLQIFRTLSYLHRLQTDDHVKERLMDLPTTDSQGEEAKAVQKITDVKDEDDTKKDSAVSDVFKHKSTDEVVLEESKDYLNKAELVGPSCKCVDCSEDELCGGLWYCNRYPGMASDEDALHRKLHIVVSHCTKSLSWMPRYLEGFMNISTIHVISKCEHDVEGAPENSTTVVVPNVGRNDHAFAYYITTILPKIASDDSVVLFLKDSMVEDVHQGIEYRRADLKSLVRVASSANGFACGLEMSHRSRSCYHETSTLYGYEMKSYGRGVQNYNRTGDVVPFLSKYNTLGDFYRALNVTSPPRLVQVCYGGIFAASARNIFKQNMNVYRTIERALERGDNIQEGHYTERVWASLLAAPLKPFQVEALRKYATRVYRDKRAAHGAFEKIPSCKCVECSEDELCGGLWHCNRYPGMASDEEALHRKLHIVVSRCTKSLSWMPRYLEGFMNISTIHVISKCGHDVEGAPENATTVVVPNVGRNDHAFAYYITTILPKIASDDSIVLFLKDSMVEDVHQGIEYRRADLKSLVRVASSANGFACGLEMSHRSRSCYHETSTLYGYEMKSYGRGRQNYNRTGDGVPFLSKYNTLGDFYRALNVTSPPRLVQVCYGGIFAASARNIFKQNMNVYRTIERALERGDNIQEGHYTERVWAPLLAAPLKPFQIEALRKYATRVYRNKWSVHGPLEKQNIRVTLLENDVNKDQNKAELVGPSCKCVDCSEDELCGGLWRCNRYPDMASDEEALHRKLHIVVSHCTKSLSWMPRYLEGFTNISTIHVISKCGHDVEGAPENATTVVVPNVGRNDHAFAYYITTILPKIASDDSVVLFLKDSMAEDVHLGIEYRRADLKSLVRVASSANGFACGLEMSHRSRSCYHETSTLYGYDMKSYGNGVQNCNRTGDVVPFLSKYNTLGDFYRALNVTSPPELVQVCYGGIFAASARNIFKQNMNVYRTIERALERGDNIQEGHYTERVWAPLLAAPLKPFQIQALAQYATRVYENRWSVHGPLEKQIPLRKQNIKGTLLGKNDNKEQNKAELVGPSCKCVDCSEDELCGGLWHCNRYPGMASDEEALHRKLHIVVSHCTKSLSWMPRYLEGFMNISTIHVISKCGHDVEGAPENATTVVVPNVGRNDHAFAYYITTILPKIASDDSVVLFLKDSMVEDVHQGIEYRRADLKSLVRVASSANGFACGLEMSHRSRSCYHETSTLYGYEMKSYGRGVQNYNRTGDGVPFLSKYNTLGDFYRALNVTSPPELVQVCYGGIFAASARNIFKQNMNVYRTIERALGRGDNIQEGHYAERVWASLLAAPLKPFQIEALRKYATRVYENRWSVHGPLEKQIPLRKQNIKGTLLGKNDNKEQNKRKQNIKGTLL